MAAVAVRSLGPVTASGDVTEQRAAEGLQGVVRGHRGSGRPYERLEAGPAAVEQGDELTVMAAVVGDDEPLERGLALVPIRAEAGAGERTDVGTVELHHFGPDLVEALEVAGEPEGDPHLVRHVWIVDLDRAQRPREVLVGLRDRRRDRFGHRHLLELDADELGQRLDGVEVGLADPLGVGHVVGRRDRLRQRPWNDSWFVRVKKRWWSWMASRSTGLTG